MKLVSVLFIVCFSTAIWGQDPLSSEDKLAHYKMDANYRSGQFLIYDCDKKIYTCVDDLSNEDCKDKRAKNIFMREKLYSCAPLKKYSDRIECLKDNYQIMEKAPFTRFCYPKN